MRSDCQGRNGWGNAMYGNGMRSLDPMCPFSARGESFFASPERVPCLVPIPAAAGFLMACFFFAPRCGCALHWCVVSLLTACGPTCLPRGISNAREDHSRVSCENQDRARRAHDLLASRIAWIRADGHRGRKYLLCSAIRKRSAEPAHEAWQRGSIIVHRRAERRERATRSFRAQRSPPKEP